MNNNELNCNIARPLTSMPKMYSQLSAVEAKANEVEKSAKEVEQKVDEVNNHLPEQIKIFVSSLK